MSTTARANTVVFLGLEGADVARLSSDVAAAGLTVEVGQLESLSRCFAVLLSLDAPAAQLDATLTRCIDLKTPLVVLATHAQQALVRELLSRGAADWVFRPEFLGLDAVFARLQREQRERAANDAAELRLREATAALMKLAHSPNFRGHDPQAALREVNNAAVQALQATRSGVWMLDSTRTTLTLNDLYDARTQQRTTGTSLLAAEHPAYFTAIRTERLVSSPDARTDPRTSGFAVDYFQPEDVFSTIDVGVQLRGELVGLICIEQCGAPRKWSPAEEVFAGALADAVSLALESAERWRAEAALRASERRFRDLFEYSSDVIVLYRVTPQGQVICEGINPACEASTGYKNEQVVGKQHHEVLDQDPAGKLAERARQCIIAKSPIVYEHELKLRLGTRVYNTAFVPMLDDEGRVYRMAAIARDVTSQRSAEVMERQLESRQAEATKQQALATLSSHIAHDVNNLLAVITAHATRLQGLEGAREVASAVLQATSRGRQLTQQILSFGKRPTALKQPLDARDLVRETRELLQPTAPSVRFVEAFDAKVPKVLADPAQLHQVLTNLATNALKAMPQGGTLSMGLRVAAVKERAGKWVCLSLSDTGPGMNEATRARLVEGARVEGAETGLGLSVVHAVVAEHGGFIEVNVRPSEGTEVRVMLPAMNEETSSATQGQRLLLVDDHPGMARVSARLLETVGYTTTVFDDPREALKSFTAAPQAFDVVLTDLSMPQMSGEDFTKAVLKVRPSVPVVVTSGLSADFDLASLTEIGVKAVLVKPWRLEEAVATLSRVSAK